MAKGTMPDAGGSLTAKQQRFVEQYLVDLNATAAYQRAGYATAPGHSSEAAASRLLSNVKVQAAIAARQTALAAEAGLSQKWVLDRLRKEAEREEEGASHSARVRATELVGKHLGMFKEQIELTGANGAPVRITEVRFKRPAQDGTEAEPGGQPG